MSNEANFENVRKTIEDAENFAPDDSHTNGKAEESEEAHTNGKAEEPEGQEPKQERQKQADILIGLAGAATLFHTPDGDAVADIKIDGHRETHLVRSPGFRKWLRHRFFQVAQSGCSNDAMKVAVDTVAAVAQFDGREMPVTFGSPATRVRSISISEIPVGGQSRSRRSAGKSSMSRPSALCAPPARGRSRCRRAAAQSNCFDHSAI